MVAINGIKGKFIGLFLMFQVFMLVIQFILGMWINLFAPPINLPLQSSPMNFMMLEAFSSPEIMSHMVIGISIGIVSVIIIISSLFTGRGSLIALGFTNGLLTLVSGISGIYFILGYMQNNSLSFIMSIGFIGVILTNFGMMHLLSRAPLNGIGLRNDSNKNQEGNHEGKNEHRTSSWENEGGAPRM